MNSDPQTILVVEDDPKISHGVSTSLKGEGFKTIRCENGADALSMLEQERADLVVLDLGLPDIDGLEVLSRIRSQGNSIPVLILTARDSVSDRVIGLDHGADDYLVKPFSLPELLARIRALSRRVEIGRDPVMRCADLEVDAVRRCVTREGTVVDLSPREFDLLHYLIAHRGEVITRMMLATEVWMYTSRITPIDNVIDVQMSRLRDKVDKPYDTQLIHTVRGVGYTLKEPE